MMGTVVWGELQQFVCESMYLGGNIWWQVDRKSRTGFVTITLLLIHIITWLSCMLDWSVTAFSDQILVEMGSN